MGRAYSVRKASIEKTGKAKAKLYSTYAKEIYLAAKSGTPDVDINVSLKRIVDKARKEEVPGDIIKRAIDKAKGGHEDNLSETVYEGFGPGASTFIIECLTDNVNRTVGFVRAAFNKAGKSLGVTNSVSYNYDHLGVLVFNYDNVDYLLESLLDSSIEIIDIEEDDGEITLSSLPNNFNALKDQVEKIIPSVEYTFDEIGMFPKEEITLNEENLKEFNRLMDMLLDIEDVSKIYHNVKTD